MNDSQPGANHTPAPLDHGDTETNNGAESQMEPLCGTGDAGAAAAGAAASDSDANGAGAAATAAAATASAAVDSADDHSGENSSGTAEPDSEPASDQTQQLGDSSEEQREEDKQEEACSPSSPANEQPAKRRACRKRRKSLFTIQAVNSNGTTERGMGEGGSAVSFTCEPHHTHTQFKYNTSLSICSHFFNQTLHCKLQVVCPGSTNQQH